MITRVLGRGWFIQFDIKCWLVGVNIVGSPWRCIFLVIGPVVIGYEYGH